MTTNPWKEEFELLSTMFTKTGESAEIISQLPSVIIRITQIIEDQTNLAITFELGLDYPNSVPNIAIHCTHAKLTRLKSGQVLESLNVEAEFRIGEPMLLDLCQLTHDKILTILQEPTESNCVADIEKGTEVTFVTIIEIDHMRNQAKYVKCLGQFARQIGLKLLVLHLNYKSKHWVILVHDNLEQSKQFLKNLKTQLIDVDSKGKPCKERLSSVIATEKFDTVIHLEKFSLEESVGSKNDLLEILNKLGIGQNRTFVEQT